VSRRCRDLDTLADDLASLVGRQKGNIGGVSAASDPYDALDRRQPCGVDEPPTIFQVDFEDGVKRPFNRMATVGRCKLRKKHQWTTPIVAK
jgi:hypothetical protein